ncbi:MAG: glucose-6-phosphate isomerase [Candidatus Tantalella remota]|nr:glucose-6-phosphate isomerase [Candidatus Tantalella remota]
MAKSLQYDTKYMEGFVSKQDIDGILPEIEKAHTMLKDKTAPGSDFLGWMDLPANVDEDVLNNIASVAGELDQKSDVMVVIGIGGSYLGPKAALEILLPYPGDRKVKFAGNNLSGDYLCGLLEYLKDKDFCVNVISKSGTTTEPAVAFRIMEKFMEEKYGKNNVSDRIVCTTDREKGALKRMADERGYRSFVIPEDVGGRFSVLTPVGLLPMACGGIDIRNLIAGAADQREAVAEMDIENNISYKYAALRNILYRKGKKIELLASFHSRLHYVDEWWKQLFGESEGKGGRGIFPASCDFSTDLHSMGQMIQEGERNLMETFLVIDKMGSSCVIPEDADDLDDLNYLAAHQMDHVNRKAYEATSEAHFEGGVPNSTIHLEDRTAYCLGQLFYFFEKAVAISALVSGVNPFDQPGVESYKNKMFKLLGKPGV